jgi:hypothetical protein
MTLAEINKRYEDIIHSDIKEPMRSHRLTDLMTEMVSEYKIPMIRSEAWEIQNKAVIVMYRKICRSREL